MFSIMLVDDQPAILAGMTTLVDDTGIAEVVAAECDGEAAIRTALELRPDLILMDVSLGGVSGADLARRLKAQWPGARLLAMSAHADPVYVRGMMAAGASGYMLKDRGPQEIADAIDTIMGGGRWIGEGLSLDFA